MKPGESSPLSQDRSPSTWIANAGVGGHAKLCPLGRAGEPSTPNEGDAVIHAGTTMQHQPVSVIVDAVSPSRPNPKDSGFVLCPPRPPTCGPSCILVNTLTDAASGAAVGCHGAAADDGEEQRGRAGVGGALVRVCLRAAGLSALLFGTRLDGCRGQRAQPGVSHPPPPSPLSPALAHRSTAETGVWPGRCKNTASTCRRRAARCSASSRRCMRCEWTKTTGITSTDEQEPTKGAR